MYTPEFVNVNGQQAAVLVPNLEGQLAVVHLEVIKRMAALMPTVPFNAIKERVLEGLGNCTNLEQLVGMMEEEAAFHKSINLIQKYEVEVPGEEVASMEYSKNNPLKKPC